MAEAAAASVTRVLKAKKNLFDVIIPTRNFGVGQKVQRNHWKRYPEASFVEITRVKPSTKDWRHGKVYGLTTFRGKQIDKEPKRLHGVLKNDWTLV